MEQNTDKRTQSAEKGTNRQPSNSGTQSESSIGAQTITPFIAPTEI